MDAVGFESCRVEYHYDANEDESVVEEKSNVAVTFDGKTLTINVEYEHREGSRRRGVKFHTPAIEDWTTEDTEELLYAVADNAFVVKKNDAVLMVDEIYGNEGELEKEEIELEYQTYPKVTAITDRNKYDDEVKYHYDESEEMAIVIFFNSGKQADKYWLQWNRNLHIFPTYDIINNGKRGFVGSPRYDLIEATMPKYGKRMIELEMRRKERERGK